MRALLVFFLLCLIGCRMPEHTQARPHWPTQTFPLWVLVDPALTGWPVEASLTYWPAAAFMGPDPAPLEVVGQHTNAGIVVINAGFSSHTTITVIGDEIVAVYVEVDQGVPEHLRLRVLVHELGHVLGLTHSTNPRSVMFWRALPQVWEVLAEDYAWALRYSTMMSP